MSFKNKLLLFIVLVFISSTSLSQAAGITGTGAPALPQNDPQLPNGSIIFRQLKQARPT